MLYAAGHRSSPCRDRLATFGERASGIDHANNFANGSNRSSRASLEVTDPQLPEGATVDILVVFREKSLGKFGSALEFLHSLPPGPRAFKTWEEYEQHLREEKDSWER